MGIIIKVNEFYLFLYGVFSMNKTELIKSIALDTKMSVKDVSVFLDSMLGRIRKELITKDGFVSILGFGRFYVNLRTARKGKNPKTGVDMQFNEVRIPKFKAGKLLKDSVNYK